MNLEEAKSAVLQVWGHTADMLLEGPSRIDDAKTEEHAWGWVIYFARTTPEAGQIGNKRAVYAVARGSGQSTPVGTKGLREALEDLFGAQQQEPDHE